MQEPSKGLDTAKPGESPVKPLASGRGLSGSIDSRRLSFQPASKIVPSKGQATSYDNLTKVELSNKGDDAISSIALAENNSTQDRMTPTRASPQAEHDSHGTETS